MSLLQDKTFELLSDHWLPASGGHLQPWNRARCSGHVLHGQWPGTLCHWCAVWPQVRPRQVAAIQTAFICQQLTDCGIITIDKGSTMQPALNINLDPGEMGISHFHRPCLHQCWGNLTWGQCSPLWMRGITIFSHLADQLIEAYPEWKGDCIEDWEEMLLIKWGLEHLTMELGEGLQDLFSWRSKGQLSKVWETLKEANSFCFQNTSTCLGDRIKVPKMFSMLKVYKAEAQEVQSLNTRFRAPFFVKKEK